MKLLINFAIVLSLAIRPLPLPCRHLSCNLGQSLKSSKGLGEVHSRVKLGLLQVQSYAVVSNRSYRLVCALSPPIQRCGLYYKEELVL